MQPWAPPAALCCQTQGWGLPHQPPVLIHPNSVQEEHTRCPAQGWGFPHVIQQFNDVAAAAAARHGVPHVDAFTPTLALMDLSFNGLHFQAPIAREVALELLGRLHKRAIHSSTDSTRTQ